MNVLVAEDEKNTADAYKLALEYNDYTVTVTDNGKDAFELFQKNFKQNYNPFDIIILDYKLPGMDGLEVAKKILEKNPKQLIVFASAFVKELLNQDIKNITTDTQRIDFLPKPFDVRTLLEKINEFSIAEELEEFRIKINPEIINKNKEEIKEIITKLKSIEAKYLGTD